MPDDDNDQHPPSPFEGGPYLRVAIPRAIDRAVPLNVSAFIREWEQMLDPVAAVRNAALVILLNDCLLDDRFVAPTFQTTGWLRQCAADEGTAEALKRSKASVLCAGHPDDYRIAAVVNDELDGTDRRMSERAIPILLGLGVTATAIAAVGLAGRSLSEKAKDLLVLPEPPEDPDQTVLGLRQELEHATPDDFYDPPRPEDEPPDDADDPSSESD